MLIRQIGLLKLLAMHYNDDGVLIQSLESPREIPVRPSAEQAVKVPLQPLQGSGDSAKRDDNSVLIFTCQYSDFTRFSPFRISGCTGAAAPTRQLSESKMLR
jgi:hypothetical protein